MGAGRRSSRRRGLSAGPTPGVGIWPRPLFMLNAPRQRNLLHEWIILVVIEAFGRREEVKSAAWVAAPVGYAHEPQRVGQGAALTYLDLHVGQGAVKVEEGELLD